MSKGANPLVLIFLFNCFFYLYNKLNIIIMKAKKYCLLFCVAWAAGFLCLMYHTFWGDLDVINALTVYALFLISGVMSCSCCNASCKKED